MTDRTRRRTGHRARLIAAVVALLAVGCSIRTDDEARPIPDVPEALFATTSTELSTSQPADTEFALTLMFIDEDNNRVPIERPWDREPSITDVLAGLAVQPTEEELAARPNIRTALFVDLEPTVESEEEGVLKVLVAGSTLRAASNEAPERLRLIYSQIVCSVVALPNTSIELVWLADADGVIPPPTEDATVLDRPVGPADFNNCETASEKAAREAAADAETDEAGDRTTTTRR